MVRPVEERISRYTEGAVLSAIRLKRYWVSQGLSESAAMERGLNQAFGMILAGGIESAIKSLDEIQTVASALRDAAVKALKEAKRRGEK